MSTDKTHVEIRNENSDRELFEFTDEMREAMDQARMENIRQTASTVEPVADSEKSNFRPYDQMIGTPMRAVKDESARDTAIAPRRRIRGHGQRYQDGSWCEQSGETERRSDSAWGFGSCGG